MKNERKTNVKWYGYTDNLGKPQASLLVKILVVVILGIIPAIIISSDSKSGTSNTADACKCESVFAGQRLKKSMGGVAGGDDYNKCIKKYRDYSGARKACLKN
jgi:hypothetical protein